MIRSVLLLLALATPAVAQDRPQALAGLLDYHQAACAAQGGTLTVPGDAVTRAFLLGPEDPALILDSRKLSCSTAPAMFCADTIGCEINVFQDGAQHSLVVQEWSLVPDDDRQLLQVTIAGELLNRPEPGIFRMTWDPAANSLTTIQGD
ncbi:MAG: hypothetical protein ACK4IU_17605 [Tabrizicola flagellatus]|uniref:hypothetical protein n=1 Tax=Tabrizicola flagellatus TaxID=2593021 RepID=UPI003919456D